MTTTLSDALRGMVHRTELNDADRFVLELAAGALDETDTIEYHDEPATIYHDDGTSEPGGPITATEAMILEQDHRAVRDASRRWIEQVNEALQGVAGDTPTEQIRGLRIAAESHARVLGYLDEARRERDEARADVARWRDGVDALMRAMMEAEPTRHVEIGDLPKLTEYAEGRKFRLANLRAEVARLSARAESAERTLNESARLRSAPRSVDVERVEERNLGAALARMTDERNAYRAECENLRNAPPTVCTVDVDDVADDFWRRHGIVTSDTLNTIRKHIRRADPETLKRAMNDAETAWTRAQSNVGELDDFIARAALSHLGLALAEPGANAEDSPVDLATILDEASVGLSLSLPQRITLRRIIERNLRPGFALAAPPPPPPGAEPAPEPCRHALVIDGQFCAACKTILAGRLVEPDLAGVDRERVVEWIRIARANWHANMHDQRSLDEVYADAAISEIARQLGGKEAT